MIEARCKLCFIGGAMTLATVAKMTTQHFSLTRLLIGTIKMDSLALWKKTFFLLTLLTQVQI